MSEINRIEILDADSDEYREAAACLPHIESERRGLDDAVYAKLVIFQNRVVRWDGKLVRIGVLPADLIQTVVRPALIAASVRAIERAERTLAQIKRRLPR
jgi:hypothetical protein